MGNSERGISDLLGSVLILLVGIAVLGGGIYLYQTSAQATSDAVTVEGTVVATDIEHSTVNTDSGGPEDRYSPEIQYRYSYEGETYMSSELCPGEGSACGMNQREANRDEVEEFLEDYPEGGEVTVYVPEDNPEGAYLDDSDAGTDGYLFLVGFGVLAIFMGLLGTVSKLRGED